MGSPHRCEGLFRRTSGILRRFAFLIATFAMMPTPIIIASDVGLTPRGATAGRYSNSTAPGALRELLERSLSVINAHPARISDLAPYTDEAPSHSFSWLVTERPREWHGAVMTPPASTPGTYLAVFHAWHSCEGDGDHVHRLVRTPKGWRLGAEIPEADPDGLLIRDHELNVHIDPPHAVLTVTDRIRVEHSDGESAGFALLRLSEDFRVETVRLDDADGTPVPFTQAGGIVAFAPPASPKFMLYLKYAGHVAHSDGDYILSNEATINSYWYPHTARLPATATITVAAPAGWAAIAPGELVSPASVHDGTVTTTYRNDLPASFMTVDAGIYKISTRRVKGRILSVYLLGANPDLASRCLDLLQESLGYFEKVFGPFPYSRYAVVETQGPFSGALEAYSFATFGPHTLPETIVHELSHTWWGGLVPCTYTRSMWNEAFADYSEALFRRAIEGDKGDQSGESPSTLRQSSRTPFNNITVRSAHDTNAPSQEAVGYGKGAMVMRVLEEQLGQETMLSCMRRFAEERRNGAPAEWADFAAVVREVTGTDYGWFFSQWLDRTGLPAVRLGNVAVVRQGDKEIVTGDVIQDGAPYRLRMPIELTIGSGAPIRTVVRLQDAVTHFKITSGSPPIRVTLDPEGLLPFVQPTGTPEGQTTAAYAFPSR